MLEKGEFRTGIANRILNALFTLMFRSLAGQKSIKWGFQLYIAMQHVFYHPSEQSYFIA